MRNTLNSFIILTMIVTFNPVRSCNENYIVYKPTAIRSDVDISRELCEFVNWQKLLCQECDDQEVLQGEEIFELILKRIKTASNDVYFNVSHVVEFVEHYFNVELSKEQIEEIEDMNRESKIQYFISKISQRVSDARQEKDYHNIKDNVLKVLKNAPNYETPYKLPISIGCITKITINRLELYLSETQKKSLIDILSSYLSLYEYVRNIRIREGARLDKKNFENFLAVMGKNAPKHIMYFDAFEINDLIYNCLNVELSKEQIESIEHINAKPKVEYFNQRMCDAFREEYRLTKVREEDFQAVVDCILKVLKETPNYETSYKLPICIESIASIIDNYFKSSFNINLSEEQRKSLRDILLFYENTRRKKEQQMMIDDIELKFPEFKTKLSREVRNILGGRYGLTELQKEDFNAMGDSILKILNETPSYRIPYQLPISTKGIMVITDNYLESSFDINLSKEQKKSLRDTLSSYERDRAKKEQIIITKLSQEGCNVLKGQHELTELKNKDFQAIRGSVLKILNETSGYQIPYKLPISIENITVIINERLKLSFSINLSEEQRKYLESFLSFYEYARKKTEQFSQEGRQHRPIELQDKNFQAISNSVLKKFQSYERPYKLPISIDDITIIINECLKSASNINLSEEQKKSLGDILSFYEDTRGKLKF